MRKNRTGDLKRVSYLSQDESKNIGKNCTNCGLIQLRNYNSQFSNQDAKVGPLNLYVDIQNTV